MNARDYNIELGDKYVYVPGGFTLEVYDILRGGAFIELQDTVGAIYTVTPAEITDNDDYKKVG